MQTIKRPSVDWHWDEPLWPNRARMPSCVAERFTLWRCARCGTEVAGGQAWERLRDHHETTHPGKPMVFTVYPVSVGIHPRGRDA